MLNLFLAFDTKLIFPQDTNERNCCLEFLEATAISKDASVNNNKNVFN